MKKIFTLIVAAFLTLGAQAAEDLTLNASETVAFGDWGFSNEAAPTLNFSNWSDGGGWQFDTALSQDDYCGVNITFEATTETHVTFYITYESGSVQSLDVPTGSTSVRTDFDLEGGITKIGFKYGDWEDTQKEEGANITITSAVLMAQTAGGEATELAFADLNPGEDESIKDDAEQTVTLTRYSTYPAWYFDPAISSDDYEKVIITFAEPVPDDGILLNAEGEGDNWSGTSLAGIMKGATKVSAYLSKKPGKINSIGFFYSYNEKQGTDDVTTLKIAKAELVKKSGSSTGINTIQTVTPKENGTIYTLSGQRVSHPVKGINIIGGKKIVIK